MRKGNTGLFMEEVLYVGAICVDAGEGRQQSCCGRCIYTAAFERKARSFLDRVRIVGAESEIRCEVSGSMRTTGKLYKEAVRMRKKCGLVNPTASAGNNNSSNHAAAGHHYQQQQLQQQRGTSNSDGTARPSLKIFSYPDHRRQKGIKDENVPFSRCIGISARQHEIIREQHRMLA